MVEAYRRWIAEQGAEQIEREADDRWRLRKPDVLVDPWGEGVFLALPPQQVPATEVQADVAWQVRAGEETYLLPVRVRRVGFDWKTTEESLPLRQPAETFEVSLLANGQIKNTWRYQGIDDKHPLLVFDAERGTLLRLSYSLPARRLGLLYPARLDLHIEGDASLLEEWPRLPWDWAVFCGQTWDLKHATRFGLREDGRERLTVTLRPDEAKQRPTLEGGKLLVPEKPGVRAPVYEGPPPNVRIPWTGRRSLDEELVRWRVTVQNKWAASPSLELTGSLADLRAQLAVHTEHVELLLRHPSLLGERAFGSYLVRLRGPLGRGAEFTLRTVPHLAIAGHEELYLPDPRSGPMTVPLLIETLPGYYLEGEGKGGECRIEATRQQGNRWEYQVAIDPDVTDVTLTLAKRLSSGDTVRVPVAVSIRRLRWALVSDQTAGERRDWTGRIIRAPVDALLQAESPCLLFDLPAQGKGEVHLGLRLVDIEGDVLQEADPVTLPAARRFLRFDLTAFLDTIRSSRSPVLRLELEGHGLPGHPTPLRWPVLSLTRSLIVEDVHFKVRREGQRPVFELRWHEPISLRSRHVRFWPLWRPWDPVFEQAIPDTAEGDFRFDAPPAQLRSGKYRLEFLVVDPWVPQVPHKPPKDAPGTVDIELISPARQLQHLEARIQEQGERFELLLERAVLHHDMGNPEKAQPDRQWCYAHLDDGTVPQILTLVELVQAAGDAATLRALQMKMFAASRFERILQAQHQGEISREHFDAYLDNLPRSRLLPRATCQQLLSVENEAVRLHAVQQLIHREATEGMKTVLDWVEGARLSDADAVALLKHNVDSSVAYLQKQLPDPNALRLLRALSQDMGDQSLIVQAGTWIFCDAGWGRIEQIEDLDGQPVGHFIRGQTGYRLHVTLRPGIDAEPIVVDLERRVIHFPEANYIYTCAKCASFSARDCHLIVSEHDGAAHDGIGPTFRQERSTTRPLSILEYRHRIPHDQLAILPRPDAVSTMS